ncbi:MAG: group 1 truncated hemoglobin [Pseudomonadaceae bacterium]|nr:group 1 truncated hemoglobin [Pseudomonadaceae bacterium]
MTNEPLFERLGGESGLEALADAFLIRLAEDEVVVATFDDTDIDQFRGHLIDQLCELSGGPCTYEGRTMAEAHSGLNISPKQFNSLVEDLMQAMADVDIPLGARNELLGMLAPMYHDTIGG